MEQMSLFDDRSMNMSAPLASRLRPETLADFVGQEQIRDWKSRDTEIE